MHETSIRGEQVRQFGCAVVVPEAGHCSAQAQRIR
jgi:hypothetical protein